MDSLTTLSTKQVNFFATYCPQEWSFPDSLIYYITKNPSTKQCYEKMYQSCKHFFIKNPILIVQCFDLFIYEKNKELPLFNEHHVDYSKLISKIWITEKLYVNNGTPVRRPCLNSLVAKIYKSDIKELYLGNQYIAFMDLKFIALKCQSIKFSCGTVMYEDGRIVSLEKIVEILPCLKELNYHLDKTNLHSIKSTTVPELLQIPHFCNLTDFHLTSIPEAFDIDAFYSYIKKNKNTKIRIDFANDVSDGYKSRLQKIVKEMIKNKKRNFKVPMIIFPGQSNY